MQKLCDIHNNDGQKCQKRHTQKHVQSVRCLSFKSFVILTQIHTDAKWKGAHCVHIFFFWINVLLSRENVIFNKVPVLFIMVEFITEDPMEQVYVCS